MKIGFEAKRFFTNYTGLGNYSRFIVNALSEHAPAHEYFLFTPRAAVNEEVSPIVSRSNIKVIKPLGIFLALKLSSLWRSWGVSFDIHSKPLHLYHGLSQELPLGLLPHIKKVVTVHDLIFLRFPQFYNPIDVAIYRTKVKSACRRADKIIAISRQTAQDLIDYLKVDESKIQVIYQGCHPNFKRVVTAAEIESVKKKYGIRGSYILNVGTIEERKNLLVLVQALARIPVEQRKTLLVIGRPTKYYKKVIAEAYRLGILQNIRFLTDASFQDFPAIFQGATAFVYPSFFEGFGIPLIEAIESNIPVITSSGSCFSEAAGPYSKYADPHNPEDLASKLLEVLTDPDLRKMMVEKSREYVRQFEPKIIATHLNTLYTSL